MRAKTQLMLRAAAAVAFAAALSPLALGQSADVERATRAERERRAAEDARRLASWELKLLEQRKAQARRHDPTLAYAQIRDDYKQLQIVNNDLARSVSAGGALDFDRVAKSVSEIRKRASRLRENLALPEAEDLIDQRRPEVGAESEQLKSALSVLDKLILGFVNSPIFEQAMGVNVRVAAKAGRELEEIIEVSDQIRKSSEKLKKLARKSQ